jgi:hypothetical protein
MPQHQQTLPQCQLAPVLQLPLLLLVVVLSLVTY